MTRDNNKSLASVPSSVRDFSRTPPASIRAFTLADADIADQLVLDMILEIKQKAYADPDSPTSFGLEPGESLPRDTFDDVDDYFQYHTTTPCLPNGAPYPQAAALTRAVTVRRVAANDFSQTVSADEGFKEVTITVAKGQSLLAQHAYVIPYTP